MQDPPEIAPDASTRRSPGRAEGDRRRGLPTLRDAAGTGCIVTAITIWWGCWQWACEANAPPPPPAPAADRAPAHTAEQTPAAPPTLDHDRAVSRALEIARADSSVQTFTHMVATVTESVLAPEPAPALEPEPPEPVYLGSFRLTYYWMTSETSYPGEASVQLYDRRCRPIRRVSPEFADRLAMEGTGRLRDGRTLNVAGECECGFSPCFFVTRRSRRWGVGVETRPLVPFRSVAVDTDYIPVGTRLYIPELDGKTMPGRAPYGGFVHDGCVVADDTGGGIDDTQIDIFFAFKSHYEGFDYRHRIDEIHAYRDHPQCSESPAGDDSDTGAAGSAARFAPTSYPSPARMTG